jgi:hypothetical protein
MTTQRRQHYSVQREEALDLLRTEFQQWPLPWLLDRTDFLCGLYLFFESDLFCVHRTNQCDITFKSINLYLFVFLAVVVVIIFVFVVWSNVAKTLNCANDLISDCLFE